MARFEFTPGDDFAIKLDKLSSGADEIAKKAVYAGAKIVADAINSNLHGVLSGKSTGALASSFGIASIKKDGEGWNTRIGFDGYDSKGVPNALKARVLESGTSRMKKRPFVGPAVRATKGAAIKKDGRSY